VKPTIILHLVPRLRMCGPTPLFPNVFTAWCLIKQRKTSPSLKDVVEETRTNGGANVNNARYLAFILLSFESRCDGTKCGIPSCSEDSLNICVSHTSHLIAATENIPSCGQVSTRNNTVCLSFILADFSNQLQVMHRVQNLH
jgi:hypothetical protein